MSTTKYLFSGFGGQGILFAGKFIAYKGLIEEKGRLDLPGRPLVYGTTDRFLRCFSLNSLDDLPELPKSDEVEQITQDTNQTSLFDDKSDINDENAQNSDSVPNGGKEE